MALTGGYAERRKYSKIGILQKEYDELLKKINDVGYFVHSVSIKDMSKEELMVALVWFHEGDLEQSNEH